MKFAPALGLGALTVGSASWAQDVPQRRLDFGASAATTYESNFLKRPDDAPFGLDGKRDELRFTPAFTVDVQVPIGRQSVYLAGSAGFDFHARNKQLDSERIDLRGGGTAQLARCAGDIGIGYGRRQSDLADILVGERIENTESRLSTSIQVSCDSPGGLRPSFGYDRESVENSDELRQNGNYTSDGLSAGLGYGRPWLGEIGLNVSYRRGRYEDRDAAVPGQDDLDTYTAGINFSRKVGSQLTGSASAGFTRVNPKLPGVRGYKGTTWSLSLVWTPGGRFQTTLGTSRSIQQSNLLGISYSIVDDYRAQTTYALGDRAQLSLAANYSKRSFRDSPLTPGALLQEGDRAFRLLGSASYSASRRLSVSLDASGERRRSDNKLFEYDNFVVAVSTRLTV